MMPLVSEQCDHFAALVGLAGSHDSSTDDVICSRLVRRCWAVPGFKREQDTRCALW